MLNELIEQIIEIGKLIYQNKFVVATDGNISCRYDKDNIIITPSGLCKGNLKKEQLLYVDLDGNYSHTYLKPSSEVYMHLTVYKNRPDITAVIHAHPPNLTALSLLNISINNILPEIDIAIGNVPIADYATPGTVEGATVINELIKDSDVIILPRHGVIVGAKNLWEAYYKLERVEHGAGIIYKAKLLGEIPLLSSEQLLKIKQINYKNSDINKNTTLNTLISIITEELLKELK